MQFFVRNPREGHTKLIRNIPVTTDKLIYEIVINFDMCLFIFTPSSKNKRICCSISLEDVYVGHAYITTMASLVLML